MRGWNGATGYMKPKDTIAYVPNAVFGKQEIDAELNGSWRRRGSNARFVASKPLDVHT